MEKAKPMAPQVGLYRVCIPPGPVCQAAKWRVRKEQRGGGCARNRSGIALTVQAVPQPRSTRCFLTEPCRWRRSEVNLFEKAKLSLETFHHRDAISRASEGFGWRCPGYRPTAPHPSHAAAHEDAGEPSAFRFPSPSPFMDLIINWRII